MRGMKVSVKFKKKTIDVVCNINWLDAVVSEMKKRGCGSVLILDNNTSSAFAESLRNMPTIVLSEKQMHKNRDCLDSVQDQLFDMRFKSSDLLIGLGGGVVQDITAIAAAGYMGGCEWLSIPTTFNSMVNPTLKGQLNTTFGKNSLSYFCPPSSIVIDTGTMSYLTDQNLLVGLAELVRIAASYNSLFFEKLEKNWVDFFMREEKLILSFVLPSIKTLYRQYTLGYQANHFGYTVAEAIDWASHYNVPHGIALLFSMEIELDIGIACGAIKGAYVERVRNLIGLLLEKHPDFSLYKKKIRKLGTGNILLPVKYAADGQNCIPMLFPKKTGALMGKPVHVPISIVSEQIDKYFMGAS